MELNASAQELVELIVTVNKNAVPIKRHVGQGDAGEKKVVPVIKKNALTLANVSTNVALK